jgi:hypothetical protein
MEFTLGEAETPRFSVAFALCKAENDRMQIVKTIAEMALLRSRFDILRAFAVVIGVKKRGLIKKAY